jgi:hypothetical protein
VGRPRGTGRHRGDVGPVPVPRHPVGLGHVHPRLSVPAVARRRRHRGGGGHPLLRRGDGPRVRCDRAPAPRPTGAAAGVVVGDPPLVRHGRDLERAGHPHRPVRLPRDGLLPLRVGTRRRLPRAGRLRRRARAPPALARGDAGRGTADRRRRQRRHRRDPGAGPGRGGRRPCHDAPAQPQLRHGPPRARRRRGSAPPGAAVRCGAPGGPRQERRPVDDRLPGPAPVPGCRAPPPPPPGAGPSPGGVCRRHPLLAALRPLGPAPVRGPRRRPLRRPRRRTGGGRHRHHRAVRARRHPTAVRRTAAGGRRRHGDRPADRGRRRGRSPPGRRAAGGPERVRLQGGHAVRRPEPRARHRLHQRELDPAGRPLRPLVLLARPLPRSTRVCRSHPRSRSRARGRDRCSTSPPATSAEAPTSCRAKVGDGPGASSRATSTTSPSCGSDGSTTVVSSCAEPRCLTPR